MSHLTSINLGFYYFNFKNKQMEKVFKTLVSNNIIDLIPYIKEYTNNHPETEILIGCDSQNRKRETVYAIVIGLYNPGKGAHVIYTRFSTIREKDMASRLISEIWFSVEIAEYIKAMLNVDIKWIDIDINYDERWGSNKVLTSALGIVKGMGYKVRYKNSPEENNLPLVTYCADHLVH